MEAVEAVETVEAGRAPAVEVAAAVGAAECTTSGWPPCFRKSRRLLGKADLPSCSLARWDRRTRRLCCKQGPASRQARE